MYALTAVGVWCVCIG